MKECQVCKRCFDDSIDLCPDDGMPTFQSLSGEPILEGKYHLERRLGQGGMGVVYKARHGYLKTPHAIKVILPDLVGNDPQLVTRFRQEALAAAAIRHQNVVSVSDYGVHGEKMPFLVMEYVDGESLHDMLAREGRLTPERAFEIMAAICAGVGAAHHQGIVHRDLKPLNVMICSDKKSLSQAVKILDFGLAKIKSGELLGSFIQAQTTGLMGSPYYMAPEQWADEEPDARADIYSLGIMLFQMIAGDVPFKGSSIPAIMKKHLSDAAPALAGLGVNISPDLERAIRHAIEKDRLARTQSCEQLVEEFQIAAGISSGGMTSTLNAPSTSALPVSSMSVVSDPPAATVFVDGVNIGVTKDDGPLLVEGVQTGNHRVRVTREGYKVWEADVFCDGKPQHVVARLIESGQGIPRPDMTMAGGPLGGATVIVGAEDLNAGMGTMGAGAGTMGPGAGTMGFSQETLVAGSANLAPEQETMVASAASTPKKSKKGLVFGIIGIVVLLALIPIGYLGLKVLNNLNPQAGETSQGPVAGGDPKSSSAKNEMVLIAGGKFKMGRNDGPVAEQPEHEVEVKDFWIDKTEVTNGEYSAFVAATGYAPPRHFENGKPISGDANRPVRFVSLDDVSAFARWRSERDGVVYRLPTEEEWEYVARNGADGTVYPWGNKFEEGRAVVDRTSTAPEMVNSKSEGSNKWGVADLVGNVWEWTGTKLFCYPGNKVCEIKDTVEPHYIVRGGSAEIKSAGNNGIKSTTRVDVEASKRDGTLGFRLARNP